MKNWGLGCLLSFYSGIYLSGAVRTIHGNDWSPFKHII